MDQRRHRLALSDWTFRRSEESLPRIRREFVARRRFLDALAAYRHRRSPRSHRREPGGQRIHREATRRSDRSGNGPPLMPFATFGRMSSGTKSLTARNALQNTNKVLWAFLHALAFFFLLIT